MEDPKINPIEAPKISDITAKETIDAERLIKKIIKNYMGEIGHKSVEAHKKKLGEEGFKERLLKIGFKKGHTLGFQKGHKINSKENRELRRLKKLNEQ